METKQLGMVCYAVLLGIAMWIKPEVLLANTTDLGVALAPIIALAGHSAYKNRNAFPTHKKK